MKKAALFATGLAILAFAGPAYASWAESPNMRYPVYTGTARAEARAQQGLDRSTTGRLHIYRHQWHRHHVAH
jgi:hypothetical protein